jgi:hypothetical protein
MPLFVRFWLCVNMKVNVQAQIAQLVEHILGKDEVTSSILVLGF